MANRLLNIRLSPEDDRLAKSLRARGLSLSDIVRRALREAAARTEGTRIEPGELEAEMLRLYPTPASGPAARPDTLDRDAVREHIRTKLRTPR